MTSLGTCRLVMPRSESTMARAGPSASSASKDARIAAAVGKRGEPLEDGAQPVVRAQAGGGEGLAVRARRSAGRRHARRGRR